MENEVNRQVRSMRLTDEAWETSIRIGTKLGIKPVAVFEIAIRDFAVKMGVNVAPTEASEGTVK